MFDRSNTILCIYNLRWHSKESPKLPTPFCKSLVIILCLPHILEHDMNFRTPKILPCCIILHTKRAQISTVFVRAIKHFLVYSSSMSESASASFLASSCTFRTKSRGTIAAPSLSLIQIISISYSLSLLSSCTFTTILAKSLIA